jgi:hypothetical protein
LGLDIVELIMAVEEEFAFAIPDVDAGKLETVGQLFAYVQAHAPTGSAPDAWARLLAVVAREVGVEQESLRAETRFVYDLRMD